jgi:hypothetical protein
VSRLEQRWTSGPTPLTLAFYTYGFDTAGYEWRHWLSVDTGYSITAYARRISGGNARTTLSWFRGTILCDVTYDKGNCSPGG